MILIGNYSIVEDINNNRIVINLPQTIETLSSTELPIENRRKNLHDDELLSLLYAVVNLYNKEKDE